MKRRIRRLVHRLSLARAKLRQRGIEDFLLPGSATIWDRLPFVPNIINLHNLHGFLDQGATHFDLRALPDLQRRSRLAFTLQDPWLTTGHCAHPFACERWRSACGQCPDLASYPSIRRDATAENLATKARIYANLRATVVGCCEWVFERARASVLGVAMDERSRVINNGIDLDYFSPGEAPDTLRLELAPSSGDRVVAYISDHGRRNLFRDYAYAERVAIRLGGAPAGGRLVVLEVGGARSQRSEGRVTFVGTGYVSRERVRDILRASDALLHPARADTYPTSVMEAMACGIPVVATRVGGIPEQIDDGVDGLLVDAGDVAAGVHALNVLLAAGRAGGAFGEAARARAALFRRVEDDRCLRDALHAVVGPAKLIFGHRA